MANFRRKAYGRLLDWKHAANGASAVLVEGPRRAGKTTTVREFCENEYESYLLIDFARANRRVRGLFEEYMDDLDRFFQNLQLETGVRLHKRRSAIVFDEVQRFPLARQSIKYLVEDGRYDYLETGSLVSIRKNVEGINIPSEEEVLPMGPMDFEEFLWALGEDVIDEAIAESFRTLTPLWEGGHRRASRLFREYLLVGGMPQSVLAYVPEKDLGAAEAAKRRILTLYREDIAKFSARQQAKVTEVFDFIPSQLSRANKTFRFSSAHKDGRSDDLAEAFFWLEEAQFIHRCYRVREPSAMLAGAVDRDRFKVYFVDTGLLATLSYGGLPEVEPVVMRDVLNGRLGTNNGMLMENAVAQSLSSAGHPLYYWETLEGHNRYEVDFLIARPFGDAAGHPRVSPIEVKSSGRHLETKSLDIIAGLRPKAIGTEFVLAPKPMDPTSRRRIRLPLYMAGLL